MSRKTQVLAIVLAFAAVGAGPGGGLPESRSVPKSEASAAATAEGGADLRWCLRGLQWAATRDGGALEVIGTVLMLVHCR